MKTYFFAFLMSLGATSAFAADAIAIPKTAPVVITDVNPPSVLPIQESVPQKEGFFYIRFTAGETDTIRAGLPAPGLGLGYRRLAGDGAADISVSGIGIAEHRNSRYFWTAPKASYYHYLQPNSAKSFYLGGGLAWGGVGKRVKGDDRSSDSRQEFIGIIPSAAVGYEFAHKAAFLGFTELTVSQPALAVNKKGSFVSPIAELSIGIGF